MTERLTLENAIANANTFCSLGNIQAQLGHDDGAMARRLGISESAWQTHKKDSAERNTHKGFLRACRYLLVEMWLAVDTRDSQMVELSQAKPSDQDLVNEMDNLLQRVMDLAEDMHKRGIRTAFEIRQENRMEGSRAWIAAGFTKNLKPTR